MGIEKKPTIHASDTRFVVKLKESIIQLYDITRKNRIQGDNVTFRVTDEPGGRVGHAIIDVDGREIDGSIDDAAGVDLSDVTDINIDVLHLGNLVSKTQALNASKSYYLEIDTAATAPTTVANSIVLTEGLSFPAPSANKLYYKLLQTDANKRAIIYRGAWTEFDGTNIDLRHTQITAPDVPLGTKRFWDAPASIPLGWELVAGNADYPSLAVYKDGDALLGTNGGTIGSRYAYLDHKHHQYTCLSYPFDAAGTAPLESVDIVEEWTATSTPKPSTTLNGGGELDITAAATIHVMIKRVAI